MTNPMLLAEMIVVHKLTRIKQIVIKPQESNVISLQREVCLVEVRMHKPAGGFHDEPWRGQALGPYPDHEGVTTGEKKMFRSRSQFTLVPSKKKSFKILQAKSFLDKIIKFLDAVMFYYDKSFNLLRILLIANYVPTIHNI